MRELAKKEAWLAKEREEISAMMGKLAKDEELADMRKETLGYEEEVFARPTEELERFRQESAPLAGPST